MTVASATRAHAAGEAQGAPTQPPPAVPLVQQSRLKRFWNGLRSLTEATMLWLSAIGTVALALYQWLYAWQKLPAMLTPKPGASAWLVGIIMLVAYVASKMPHLLGQEPGDAKGHVRELVLNLLNWTFCVVFLVRAYGGMPHAENAVGISIMLLVMLLGMMIAQAVQTVVLSRRTWTDSTGAASI